MFRELDSQDIVRIDREIKKLIDIKFIKEFYVSAISRATNTPSKLVEVYMEETAVEKFNLSKNYKILDDDSRVIVSYSKYEDIPFGTYVEDDWGKEYPVDKETLLCSYSKSK